MTIFEDARVTILLADHIGIDGGGKANVLGAGFTVTGIGPQGLSAAQHLLIFIDLPPKHAGAEFALSLELRDETTGSSFNVVGPDGTSQPLRVQQMVRGERPMVPNVYLPDTVPIRVQLNLAFPNGLPLAPGHNSAVALKRPGIDRGAQKRTYLTPLHMARWLAAADESPDALLMGLLLGECGLRIGEATGLDIEDLGEHRGHDTMTVLGKGNKTAVIPIPVPVMRVLRDTIGDRTTGPVLLNKRGRRMTRSNAGYLIRKVALAAGVSTDISPHTFRRVMITTALQMGIPVHKVQLAARHSSINTTMIYNRYDGFDDHATHTVAGFYSQFA